MAICIENLKYREYYLVDAGLYSFILAFPIGKTKTFLVAANAENTSILYDRAPFNPKWKWKSIDSQEVLEILQTAQFVFKRIPKEGVLLTEELIAENEKIPLPNSLNCIAGNIVEDRIFGEQHEIRHGTKHFRPGAKVYIRPVTMGQPYDSWKATGKPRGRFGYITVAIDSKLITNLRTTVVYSPSLIEKLYMDYVYWDSKEDAQLFLEGLKRYCPERANSINSL